MNVEMNASDRALIEKGKILNSALSMALDHVDQQMKRSDPKWLDFYSRSVGYFVVENLRRSGFDMRHFDSKQ